MGLVEAFDGESRTYCGMEGVNHAHRGVVLKLDDIARSEAYLDGTVSITGGSDNGHMTARHHYVIDGDGDGRTDSRSE